MHRADSTGPPAKTARALGTSFSPRELAEVLLDQRQSASNRLKAVQRLNEFLTASQSADDLMTRLQRLNARQLVPSIVELFHSEPLHPCRLIAFRALSLFAHTRDLHPSVVGVLVPTFSACLAADERGTLYEELSIDALHAMSSSNAAVLLMTRHGAMQVLHVTADLEQRHHRSAIFCRAGRGGTASFLPSAGMALAAAMHAVTSATSTNVGDAPCIVVPLLDRLPRWLTG